MLAVLTAGCAANDSLYKKYKGNPFVNSLGMKFVPVPVYYGKQSKGLVLMSIWDTRVKDYQAFCDATGRSHKKPGFLSQGMIQ